METIHHRDSFFITIHFLIHLLQTILCFLPMLTPFNLFSRYIINTILLIQIFCRLPILLPAMQYCKPAQSPPS